MIQIKYLNALKINLLEFFNIFKQYKKKKKKNYKNVILASYL